ncbi:TlpA family protein disulfide reductase [Eudoraea chungangensis]|uniref:TlpA family protein disulfide reductase n=1 Tax=Eudoraea chungangensis TaxID=1481905 RepID=UPI0023EB5D55|nr:TlpA disulfide reductase family protein [Eudoraea chungangensis]
MKVSKKTIWNLFIIVFVLSFFVTPIGFQAKVLLNQLFASEPDVLEPEEAYLISDFSWKLKNADGRPFNFRESKGEVIFVNFWASWRLPCVAELRSIQKMYKEYQGRMVFYLVTNEEREPVVEFMKKNDFNFPVTYLIIGEKAPFDIPEAPASYLIDRNGVIRIVQSGIADWDNQNTYQFINQLLE